MFLFAVLSACEYIEITESNKKLIGGERPIFMKFYSPECGHCKQMAPDFAEASTMTKDVDFGGVDCKSEEKICKDYKVDGYPTIILFGAGNATGAEFKEHERNVDGFIDFIEETLRIKVPRPPKYMKDLTPLNFNATINNNKCAFVTFFAPWCGHCKKFIPEAKKAAEVFNPDNATVSIATLNCEKYKSICEEQGVTGFPTVKLFVNGKPESFEGARTVDGVADFINAKCGTERASNGLLNDKAGIIAEAQSLVAEFIEAADKTEIIAKAKAIKADLYATFMERVVKSGVEQGKKDLAKMASILEARTASFKVLDNLKKRFNVFSQILGEKKAEEEKPAEEEQQKPAEEEQQKPAEEEPKAEEEKPTEELLPPPVQEKPEEQKEL